MIQEQSIKRQQLSITILIALFFGSLFYAIYKEYEGVELTKEVSESKKIIPEYFDFGKVVDSTYCNDFFGFRIPISKGHEAHYKKYDFIEKSILKKDTIPIRPRLTTAINDEDLLVILPELVVIDLLESVKSGKGMEAWTNYESERSKREWFGADYQLVIRAHKFSGNSLSTYVNSFDNLHNPNYGNTKSKMISGILFQEYHGQETQGNPVQQTMFQITGGKIKKITSFVTQINGFALSIDLFYLTEKQKCILLDMVDTIYFNQNLKHTFQEAI